MIKAKIYYSPDIKGERKILENVKDDFKMYNSGAIYLDTIEYDNAIKFNDIKSDLIEKLGIKNNEGLFFYVNVYEGKFKENIKLRPMTTCIPPCSLIASSKPLTLQEVIDNTPSELTEEQQLYWHPVKRDHIIILVDNKPFSESCYFTLF